MNFPLSINTKNPRGLFIINGCGVEILRGHLFLAVANLKKRHGNPFSIFLRRNLLFADLGTIHYLREWGAKILRGSTYFWQVTDGGHFFGAKK